MKSDLTTILESFVDLDQELLLHQPQYHMKTVKDFPIELRIPENEISGCQSRVWVLGEQVNGQWNFAIDSDAYIVKGIGKLLCTTFNGCKTQDVLDIKFHDFKPIAGLLTTQRQRGIQSVINSIHYLVNTDK